MRSVEEDSREMIQTLVEKRDKRARKRLRKDRSKRKNTREHRVEEAGTGRSGGRVSVGQLCTDLVKMSRAVIMMCVDFYEDAPGVGWRSEFDIFTIFIVP